MYHSEELERILNVQSTKEFIIPQDYTNLPMEMILVEGTMKDTEALRNFTSDFLHEAKY